MNGTYGNKMWMLLGLVIVCAGIALVVMYTTGALNPNQTSAPGQTLTTEQKYSVLGQLGSSTAATGTRTATSSPEQQKKQQAVKSASVTSASSTQSDSEKLDILRALQH